MIYEFRFRDGIRGVVTKHVEAATLAEADRQAQVWVNAKPGTTYIPNSCEAWLVTVAEAEPEGDVVAADTAGKPSTDEQKRRLQAQSAERKGGTGVGSSVKGEPERVGA